MTDPALVDYVSRRFGLTFAGPRGKTLREALDRAAAASAGSDAGSVVARLETRSEEFAQLCEDLTVQESFFFREPAKLDLLRELARHERPAGRPLRVWSAGCAAGEEVYTLAAVLADAPRAGRFHILGTDLSPAAVRAAKRGCYGRWALRGLDEQVTARLFTTEGRVFRVRDRLRGATEFRQHNLLDPLPEPIGRFDVIFCRNVLIYLTQEAVRRAADRLAQALAPGGWLVTGAADPMLGEAEGLRAVRTAHGLAYRRPAGTPSPGPPTAAPPTAARPRKQAEVADLGTLVTRGQHALDRARPLTAERLARRVLDTSARHRDAHRILVLALAQRQLVEDAVAAAATAVAAFPADAEMRHLHAAVLLDSGDVGGARTAAERAVRLDPELTEAHLLLSRAHELLGEHEQARRTRRDGRRLLAAHQATR